MWDFRPCEPGTWATSIRARRRRSAPKSLGWNLRSQAWRRRPASWRTSSRSSVRDGRGGCHVWARSFAVSVDAAGSCGVHSFLGTSSSMLRGSTSTALSFAETEAGAAGPVSGLVHRMNSMPDADGAVSSARSERGVDPFQDWVISDRGWKDLLLLQMEYPGILLSVSPRSEFLPCSGHSFGVLGLLSNLL